MVEERQYRRLLRLLSLIGLFNVLDFFATQDLVVFGEHCEWNPLMRPLVGTVYSVCSNWWQYCWAWSSYGVRRSRSQISGLSLVSLWGLWVVNGLHLGGVLRPVMMEGMCYAGCGCCMVLSLWSCVGQFL